MWEATFYFFILIFIPCLFFYLSLRVKNDHIFTEKCMSSNQFLNVSLKYTGFSIFVDKNFLLSKLDLFKKISKTIEPCIFVDVSNNNIYRKTDERIIDELQINVLPSILYIKNGVKKEEISNFMEFNGLSDSEIIEHVKLRIERTKQIVSSH